MTKTLVDPVTIRPTAKADLKAVAELLRGNGITTVEEINTVLETLNCRSFSSVVAVFGAEVLGFVMYQIRRQVIEIVTIVVQVDYKRRGLGAFMVQALADKARTGHRQRLVAVVPLGSMCLFLKACGFRAILPLARGLYGANDGVRMILELAAGAGINNDPGA